MEKTKCVDKKWHTLTTIMTAHHQTSRPKHRLQRESYIKYLFWLYYKMSDIFLQRNISYLDVPIKLHNFLSPPKTLTLFSYSMVEMNNELIPFPFNSWLLQFCQVTNIERRLLSWVSFYCTADNHHLSDLHIITCCL